MQISDNVTSVSSEAPAGIFLSLPLMKLTLKLAHVQNMTPYKRLLIPLILFSVMSFVDQDPFIKSQRLHRLVVFNNSLYTASISCNNINYFPYLSQNSLIKFSSCLQFEIMYVFYLNKIFFRCLHNFSITRYMIMVLVRESKRITQLDIVDISKPLMLNKTMVQSTTRIENLENTCV